MKFPQDYVKDDQIVLNISPQAIKTLNISNAAIEFEGRFGGIPTKVYAPMHAIVSIYARENGQGMMFESDDPMPEPPAPISGVSAPSAGKNDDKKSKGLLKGETLITGSEIKIIINQSIYSKALTTLVTPLAVLTNSTA